MALRRRDWTDLLLQIISFYVIATGVGQLIWNGNTLLRISYINALYIPLIVFLKMTRKMIKSNVSVLLMQFMEIIMASVQNDDMHLNMKVLKATDNYVMGEK